MLVGKFCEIFRGRRQKRIIRSFTQYYIYVSMVWYGMVQYGMVWYGMVWYDMVWYDMAIKFQVSIVNKFVPRGSRR